MASAKSFYQRAYWCAARLFDRQGKTYYDKVSVYARTRVYFVRGAPAARRERRAAASCFGEKGDPVSYTHLDVYKRQYEDSGIEVRAVRDSQGTLTGLDVQEEEKQ